MIVSPLTGSRQEMNWPGTNVKRGDGGNRRKNDRVSGAHSTMRSIVASYVTRCVTGRSVFSLARSTLSRFHGQSSRRIDREARDDDGDLGVIRNDGLASEA